MDDSAAQTGERPDSMFGVLFVVISLAAVFGIGVALVGLRLQGADSRELYDDLFAAGAELPLELEFVGGTAVANKQRWIRLERAPAAVEADPSLPATVLIGRYAGPVPVARQFETGNLPNGRRLAERRDRWLESDEKKKWTGLIDRGVVGWGPWEADFVHLREFLDGGGFYDLIRVNLSSGPTGQILVAQWPVGVEGARVEPLREVLSVLQLDDGADDPAALASDG